jgi:hypothetical protein
MFSPCIEILSIEHDVGIDEHPNTHGVHLPLVVVLELIWVLQSAYGVSRKDVILANESNAV